MIDRAKLIKPDVIFYIGAVKGLGNPKIETFLTLKSIAPLINLCSDAADKPWHYVLGYYRNNKCFDLQVSIDGADSADLSTLTPVDASAFKKVKKDIRFGFSGSVGRWNTRSEVVNALDWFGGLTVRSRATSYEDHANFMCRTKILLNTSWTGTEQTHHIKGRVLEAGFAKCVLLEHIDSPIADWFPKEAYISWKDPKEAAEIAANLNDKEIESTANSLHNAVISKFTASKIYGEILNCGFYPPGAGRITSGG